MLCIFMLLVPTVLAAEEEEVEEEEDSIGSADSGDISDSENFQISDFWKPKDAKQELQNSAFQKPVTKGTNWGTLILIGVTIYYFARCFINIMWGDDDARAKGFMGLFIGAIAIVAFFGVTSEALDSMTWNYN
ncbi:MAG: hypothetical protein WAX23_12185 [Methanosarcina sp.]